MSSRTKARKRAIDILYGADLRDIDLADALVDEGKRAALQPDREASWRYAREIVSGVAEHADEIDYVITQNAHGWTIDRMPVVDRVVLRMGVWEILHNDEVPDAVAISEAVQLASELSTEESGSFVNGVLSAVSRAR